VGAAGKNGICPQKLKSSGTQSSRSQRTEAEGKTNIKEVVATNKTSAIRRRGKNKRLGSGAKKKAELKREVRGSNKK